MLKVADKKYKTIFFSHLEVKLWNKIPCCITDLPKKAFKRVLHKLLFDILEKEDDYIQIPMSIKEVGAWIHLIKVLVSVCSSFYVIS